MPPAQCRQVIENNGADEFLARCVLKNAIEEFISGDEKRDYFLLGEEGSPESMGTIWSAARWTSP
jgi:hypothetical protein